MKENDITEKIIGCALKVHSKLGPGLLESAYEACLYHELSKTELFVERQKPIPLVYDDIQLDCGYRCDIMVNNSVIVEIKAVEAIHDLYLSQVLTYLKQTNCKVGLLINFNVKNLRHGLRRVVHNYED